MGTDFGCERVLDFGLVLRLKCAPACCFIGKCELERDELAGRNLTVRGVNAEITLVASSYVVASTG